MKRETLQSSMRNEHGSGIARKLRREGKIPAVLYGHGSETKSLMLDGSQIEHFLVHHGVGATVDLNIDGISVFAMVKDYQRTNLTRDLLHIDFQELHKGEKVRLNVPIHFLNKEAVEDAKSVIVEQIHEIEMTVLPKDLIEIINLDVSTMNHGEAIRVMDLDIFKDDRFDVFNDPDTVVVSLTAAGTKVTEETPADEPLSVSVEMVDQASNGDE